MKSITIEKATPLDVKKLQEIGRTTFKETFAMVNSEENMREYLEHSFSTKKLAEELSNKNSQIYFAVHDNNVIGYLKINLGQAQTEKQDNDALEIERIYVLHEFQGKNVGQVLYQKAIELALEMQAPYIWLGVWEENHKAIRFYEKNGFEAFDQHVFWLGTEEQTDLMMKKILTAESKTS